MLKEEVPSAEKKRCEIDRPGEEGVAGISQYSCGRECQSLGGGVCPN